MSKQTYEVHVQASALRTMKVRAESGREALDIAKDRIGAAASAGPWVIDFPGSEDEHFSVFSGDLPIGPWPDGGLDDEDASEVAS